MLYVSHKLSYVIGGKDEYIMRSSRPRGAGPEGGGGGGGTRLISPSSSSTHPYKSRLGATPGVNTTLNGAISRTIP